MARKLRKICGMRRQSALDWAAALGFDFCGFIFHPKSPRYITPREAGMLHSWDMKRVGVFCGQSVEDIKRAMKEARLDFAQLHGPQTRQEALELGAEAVIRVIWPMRHENAAQLQAEIDCHGDACAWFLVDAGHHGGGHGNRLDWDALAGLRWPRPWFLAGGLNGECVAGAVKICDPDGVDINSGVENNSHEKDHLKMRNLVHNLIRGKI